MNYRTGLLWACAALAIAGCRNSTDEADGPAASTVPSPYVVQSEPADAQPVGDARRNVQDQEAVTLVGRIGGSAQPFVDGLAAFTIVDPSVQHCPPEEGCPTPWDYCCTQDQVKQNIAMVKFVDAQGNPVAEDARQLLGVKELSLVVVRGKAQRDDSGNLAVLANELYVKE
jgi:hypothetical protein